ncbi:excalibur calcium-binding domain-containing protein [Sphaerisporangium sp. NPDC051011]|uniref:excalibur calcium-binding domain-containing protein n=1 Tax=Sphaerisporangium sp. NPDC051011 TaxID=3155792 RepID=UPI0033E09EC8
MRNHPADDHDGRPGEPPESSGMPFGEPPPASGEVPGGSGEGPPGGDVPPEGPGGPAAPGDPAAAGGPPAGPPGPPRASRSTTIALLAGLVVVIIVTGVVGTIAVLMTRTPDRPLGAPPPRRLATTIHFAPVTGTRPAPCPGAEAVLDDTGTTCYQVAPGVTITSVAKVEAVADADGGYSVRVVPSPESRSRLASLTEDSLNQLLAVVVGDRVVTAPRVAQALTADSFSISGLTKEAADAMVARLLGAPASAAPSGAPSTCPPGTGTGQPGTLPSDGTGQTPPPGGIGQGPLTGDAGTPPGSTAEPGGTATCHPATGVQTGQPTTDLPATGQPPGAPTGQPTTGTPTGPATGAATPPATGNGSTGNGPLVPPGSTGAPVAQGGPSAQGSPSSTPAPRPTGVSAHRTPDPRFPDCKQANAAGYGPYTKGVHVEYDWYVDGDHDGYACERGDIT